MGEYFKNFDGDYIFSIGEGVGDEEITREEYENILAVIQSRPIAERGHSYKLRKDLAWELVEVPVDPESDEISDEEALDIILGVSK